MAIPRLASTPVRLRRLATICLAATVLVPTAGCKHRRSSLRPVFVEPGAVVAEPGPSRVILDDSIPSTAPPIVDDAEGFGSGEASPRLTPILPPLDSKVKPSRNASPPPADEPDLNLAPRERVPKANINGPDLNGPSASRAPGTTRRTSTTRNRLSALRDRVQPFVNDPDDLFQPPKADRPWKFVVVHHSANPSGGYDRIDRDHRKIQGWDGCGYHFVIGNGTDSPDGQIEVARRWSDQKHGLHCRNGKSPEVNEYGIGICLIGDLDDAPPTPKQVAAARALVAYLADRYDIPSGGVGTHADLANGPTACPGKHFPAEQILGSKHVASSN